MLAACGPTKIAGLGGSVPSSTQGSKLASSWVSRPSNVVALHMTLALDGSRGKGSLTVLSVYEGAFGVRDIKYKSVMVKQGLSLKLGDGLGIVDAKLENGHLTITLPGAPPNLELVPGTKSFFEKQAVRVRRRGDYLRFENAAYVTSNWLTSTSDLTSKLNTYGPNVLGADVSILEQDYQQAQAELTWVQDNVGGSFNQFICIGFTGSAQILQEAQSAYAGFKTDLAAGDNESLQLAQTLTTLEDSFNQLQVEASSQHFITNAVTSSEVTAVENNANRVQSDWTAGVGQYVSGAASYLAQTSAIVNEAEGDVLAYSPQGC